MKKINLIAIIFTIATQIPILVMYNKIFKYALAFLWILVLILNVLNYGIKVTKILKSTLMIMLIYNIFIIIMSIIKNKYISGIYFIPINMTFLFFLSGYTNIQNDEGIEYSKILKYFSIIVGFISLNLYIQYFNKVNLDTQIYMYASKNSVGVLIVFLILILIEKIKNTKFNFKRNNIIIIIFITFLIYILFSLQNRAGIVALVLYMIIFNGSSILKNIIKLKGLIIIALILIIIFIYKDDIFRFIIWSLKLENNTNLNSFSSGRIELINIAIESIKNNLLFGSGKYYIDNFFICILAEYGIVGSSIVILLLINYIKAIKLTFRKNNLIKKMYFITFIIMFFEAMPPFGPGGIYFIIWYMLGYELRNNKYTNKEED